MKRQSGILGKQAIETTAILILSTLVAFLIQSLNLRVENILIVYILSILVVIIETKSFIWGIIASIICILTFNYFFTEPIHTLVMDDPSYYVSLGIFLVAAFIVNTLTSRLQHQIAISSKNELMTDRLYKISSGYLNLSERDSVVSYCERSLADLLQKPCKLLFGEKACTIDPESSWCFSNGLPCGMGENYAEASKQRCIPILNKGLALGVLKIDCSSGDVAEDEWLYIETMLSQFVMAMEKEQLHQAEELGRIAMEKEKLQNDLLKSISHDLRTPLTAIAGGSEFLLEKMGNLDKETINSLLTDIHSDAVWLSTMVENLLDMARLQDGKLAVRKQVEVVDDIVCEAMSQVIKRQGMHTIESIPSEGILLLPMDGQLIIQVLINFLNNAIEHTRPDCHITVKTQNRGSLVEFSVSDDGGGIDEKVLGHLFESFTSTRKKPIESRKGIGLGLSICKAIILAHGGEISGKNNSGGGATFSFTLPVGKEGGNHA